MANRSIKYPRGIVEKVVNKVDKLYFFVDFVILNMEDESDLPFEFRKTFYKHQ